MTNALSPVLHIRPARRLHGLHRSLCKYPRRWRRSAGCELLHTPRALAHPLGATSNGVYRHDLCVSGARAHCARPRACCARGRRLRNDRGLRPSNARFRRRFGFRMGMRAAILGDELYANRADLPRIAPSPGTAWRIDWPATRVAGPPYEHAGSGQRARRCDRGTRVRSDPGRLRLVACPQPDVSKPDAGLPDVGTNQLQRHCAGPVTAGSAAAVSTGKRAAAHS